MDHENNVKKYINGNILQTKVLLDMGFPWVEDTDECIYLIFLEDLNILKFLHSLAIPFSKDLLTKAIGNNRVSFDTIKWLKSVGAQWDENTFEILLLFTRIDDRLEILKWMIKEECPRQPHCLKNIIYEWGYCSDSKNFMYWVKDGCP